MACIHIDLIMNNTFSDHFYITIISKKDHLYRNSYNLLIKYVRRY